MGNGLNFVTPKGSLRKKSQKNLRFLQKYSILC